MNPINKDAERMYEIIRKGTIGVILLPQNPSFDATVAALSLADAINTIIPSKYICIACANPPRYEAIGSEKIQTNITTSGNNLVISFPYTDGSIDKVDYNIQGNFFNLVIIPRAGTSKLDPQQVQYSYTGGAVDFIITIDTPTLNSLGSVFSDNQDLFQGREIINIDRHLTNSFFGSVNIINKTASSLSEIVFELLTGFPDVEVDKDIATNLYAGISAATNNFTSYSVNANTFETAAKLLRLGAAKKRTSTHPAQAKTQYNQVPVQQGNMSFETQNVKSIQSVEKEVGGEKTQTPQDWLKPKIFRGGGLV